MIFMYDTQQYTLGLEIKMYGCIYWYVCRVCTYSSSSILILSTSIYISRETACSMICIRIIKFPRCVVAQKRIDVTKLSF